MCRTIEEPTRSIAVLDEVDVLVAGGGVSGCAAAWGAARAGARTVLLERNGCLGGVATATLMANIGNRFVTGAGTQIIKGFAGELMDRLTAAGAASPDWRGCVACAIDSERLKVELIEMLEEAGVTILTHALAARPILEDTRVRGCFVESKSGRQAILAGATVDCTGEADIAWQAGADVVVERGNASTLFKLANVDIDAFVEFLKQDPDSFPAGEDGLRDFEAFTRNWTDRGIMFFPHFGGKKWRFLQDALASGEFRDTVECATNLDVLGMYALRGQGFVVINSNWYTIDDLDIRNLSRFETHAQKMCYYVAGFVQRKVPGFRNAHVAHIGTDLGIRYSRYIRGRTVLDRDAMAKPTTFDDVIGTVLVIDPKQDEYFPDRTTDVPLGVTVPRGCENLLVGSAKSISTQPKGRLRAMATCMVCGHAAGVAGAVAAKAGVSCGDAPIRDVQRELLRQNAHIRTLNGTSSGGIRGVRPEIAG